MNKGDNMANCIVCKKELTDDEIEKCNDIGNIYGLYCNEHVKEFEDNPLLRDSMTEIASLVSKWKDPDEINGGTCKPLRSLCIERMLWII